MALNKFFWESSPAGVSPGLLALDLAWAPPRTPSVQRSPLARSNVVEGRAALPSPEDGWLPSKRPGLSEADAEGTEARGRAQPRSRASSPGETPAGDDYQKEPVMG